MKKILFCAALAAAPFSVSAKFVAKSVAYEHDGVRLEGYLAYDDVAVSAKKKAPGVLVLPEWWGLTNYPRMRANQLAAEGYVAFAVDMYGAGVTTTDPKKAGELAGSFYAAPALMVGRAMAGLQQLLKTDLVDGGQVAAIGYCFGGSVAQALAYSGASLAGVVSFHGGILPVPADAGAKVKTRILMCHGAVDPFIKKDEIDGFMKAMNEAKIDYQFISYAGAVHAFTNPDADQIAKATGLPIAYHAAADRRSWAHLQAFFAEIFRRKK